MVIYVQEKSLEKAKTYLVVDLWFSKMKLDYLHMVEELCAANSHRR
jgi:hypothetical protein